MKLTFAIIAVAFAAALLLAGCVSQPDLPPSPPSGGEQPPLPPGNGTQQPYACTADAKVCPDGSYVGRIGPNCEFAPCPSTTAPMTKELCESARGSWNGCASACRGAPPGTMCTEQCVLQCECGGIAGFGCPAGYTCTDYLPVGAADAMGVCRKI